MASIRHGDSSLLGDLRPRKANVLAAQHALRTSPLPAIAVAISFLAMLISLANVVFSRHSSRRALNLALAAAMPDLRLSVGRSPDQQIRYTLTNHDQSRTLRYRTSIDAPGAWADLRPCDAVDLRHDGTHGDVILEVCPLNRGVTHRYHLRFDGDLLPTVPAPRLVFSRR
jgi:hypothetical protein